MIEDKTSIEERQSRSQTKDTKYRAIMKDLTYRDIEGVKGGELIQKNWMNSQDRLKLTSNRFNVEVSL